jgi:uncharacterized protein (DUF2235 family)
MAKNIFFCADGTWNNPYEDENADYTADPTNVYKLFLCLAGELSPDSLRVADEQEKTLGKDGVVQQVAKYLHGVGDSRNPISKIMGGAFGAGVISRIVRGYTFLSRNFDAGDNIYIVGFSRGAYTARALAGLIASQGLLAKNLTGDKEQAYRYGAQAWYRYRQSLPSDHNIITKLAEIAADLPAFLSSNTLKDGNFAKVDSITAVGVWDTVGAMGIPDYKNGANHDAFRFADTTLSTKVENGFHAMALDEQREVFSPTLWDAAGNVTQVLFPGAHADVGGGYPTAKDESGLSDGALKWMVEKLSGAGGLFSGATPNPVPAGTAHKPWAHAPWNLPVFPSGVRQFPTGMPVDPSVTARKAAGPVVADPGEAPTPYEPKNLP